MDKKLNHEIRTPEDGQNLLVNVAKPRGKGQLSTIQNIGRQTIIKHQQATDEQLTTNRQLSHLECSARKSLPDNGFGLRKSPWLTIAPHALLLLLFKKIS